MVMFMFGSNSREVWFWCSCSWWRKISETQRYFRSIAFP